MVPSTIKRSIKTPSSAPSNFRGYFRASAMELVKVIETTRLGGVQRDLVAATSLDPDQVVTVFAGHAVTPTCPSRHLVLEGVEMGEPLWVHVTSPARFLNHSCDPNCVALPSGVVITRRFVPAEEPLTIDYRSRWHLVSSQVRALDWRTEWNFRCHCGSLLCEGYVNRWLTTVEERALRRSSSGIEYLGYKRRGLWLTE